MDTRRSGAHNLCETEAAYNTDEDTMVFWRRGGFNLNRKRNIGLDKTEENKIKIKENQGKVIPAFRPLFYCSKSIRIE
jgi:hypothetical protein